MDGIVGSKRTKFVIPIYDKNSLHLGHLAGSQLYPDTPFTLVQKFLDAPQGWKEDQYRKAIANIKLISILIPQTRPNSWNEFCPPLQLRTRHPES